MLINELIPRVLTIHLRRHVYHSLIPKTLHLTLLKESFEHILVVNMMTESTCAPLAFPHNFARARARTTALFSFT